VIRIAVFLAAIAVMALGATWFAERPGEIVMTWQGWRISTSLMVAGAALLVVIAVAIVGWSLIRVLLRSPQRVADFVEERRQLRGWRAVSRGLIAVGTGNVLVARRSAGEARKLLAGEPLTLLLSAQAAQLGGDAESAEADFRGMLAHEETRLLGLMACLSKRYGAPIPSRRLPSPKKPPKPTRRLAGRATLLSNSDAARVIGAERWRRSNDKSQPKRSTRRLGDAGALC
jgi:HemY protein